MTLCGFDSCTGLKQLGQELKTNHLANFHKNFDNGDISASSRAFFQKAMAKSSQ